MRTIARTLLASMLIALCTGAAPAAGSTYAERVHLTQAEIAQLPTFCWPQLEVPGAAGAEYSFIDCGPGMNHYCGGLVNLLRAKGSTSKGQKLQLLQGAHADILYTEKWMKDYPNCNRRSHVEATKAEVETLLKIYGGKRSGSK